MKRSLTENDVDVIAIGEGKEEENKVEKRGLLRTAIQLKEAITSISKEFKPMGEVVNATIVWRKENDDDYNDEDDDEDDDENEDKEDEEDKDEDNEQNRGKVKIEKSFDSWMYKMKNVDDGKFQPFHKGGNAKRFDENVFNTRLRIDVNNMLYDGTFSGIARENEDNLKQLMTRANPASFGDQLNLKTVVDENIRKGRDIDNTSFQVSDEIIKYVEDTWNYHFYPSNVKAVPYKINLYQKGDKFIGHKDTPDKNLVGTFLLGMSHSDSESLRVYSRPNADRNQYDTWDDSRIGTWCAFHADVPHEVEHEEDCIRATMSFKIYTTQNECEISKISEKFAEDYLKKNPVPPEKGVIGIILSHDYSLNTTTLKGVDNLWYHIAKRISKSPVELIPVILSTSMYWYVESEPQPSVSMKVYPLTTQHLLYLNGEDVPKPSEYAEEIKFYKLSYDGYQWSCDSEPYIEYTGNESQPQSEDSLYIHRALILRLN